MKEFAHRLRHERALHSWSQEKVAKLVNTTIHNVSRWERGATYPGPYFREKLCELFGKSATELGMVQEQLSQQPFLQIRDSADDASKYPTTSSPLWNIPHRRNPFFTGREEVLTRLHEALRFEKTAALTQTSALSGLGGIGKTQTAIEYAYRYRDDYSAILWAKAETRDLLLSDFVMIAELLHLPEQQEQDQRRIVEAVKNWLNTHTGWLLLFDNIENFFAVKEFLPSLGKGHILATTRLQFTGQFAQHIALEPMRPGEGMLFLLRRAKLITHTTEIEEVPVAARPVAKEIVEAMDGLPLALDQAGAYIEETACGLVDYLTHYQSRQATMLALRGEFAEDHPQSVATTFSLSFQQIERLHPAATDLLRVCAFLHPDAIPEEIFTEGAPELGPLLAPIANDPLQFDAIITTLRMYSLLHRNPDTRTLTIHRLVQTVLKENMDQETQRLWAERTVLAVAQAVNSAFLDAKGSRGLVAWSRCQRCLPHAHYCTALIDQWSITHAKTGRLLDQIGAHLHESAQYEESEMFLKKALTIWMHVLGPEHLDVATNLHDLALLYIDQGKYTQADPLFQQALTIRERLLGPENAEVATSLNDLAVLYYLQGKHSQARTLSQRGLDIRRRILGPENVLIAESLNNLAVLYHYQAQYAEAEALLTQALAIAEKTLTIENPQTAFILDNAARLCRDQGKYTQAEMLFQQTLKIRERLLGPEHPLIAQTLNNMARLYYYQGKYRQGEQLCQNALTIWEATIGKEHPRTAQALNNLAMLYHIQGMHAQAEMLYFRTLAIRKSALGAEHPKTAQTLSNIARVLRDQGNYIQAEETFHDALNIYRRAFSPEHPRVAHVLNELALLYSAQNDDVQALNTAQRALDIRTKVLPKKHPDIAQSFSTLAGLYQKQGEYMQAEHLYCQALNIQQKQLASEHPDIATTREKLRRLAKDDALR